MVYVDDIQNKLGRMVMCHCIADSQKELFDFMKLIGVKEAWVQDYTERTF